MKKNMKHLLGALFLCFIFCANLFAYPYDGYRLTGIRRLERLRLSLLGEMRGPVLPEGGRKTVDEIKLHLVGPPGDQISFPPETDSELQSQLGKLFPNRDESYSVALLEITPGKVFRFAQRQADRQFSPGSVGKIAIAAGLFAELNRLSPNSTEKRRELLKNRMVTADEWIRSDDHEVPLFDPDTRIVEFRPVTEGDRFSLYEWVDHMLSASANSAASTVWKEVMLMRAFGEDYPPSPEAEKMYFSETSKNILQEVALSVVNDPLREIGIGEQEFRLGSFFTKRGKAIVPGSPSTGTPIGMLKYLVGLEQGRIVDEWSSREIKRLLYMTTKRIRYASAPALGSAAVYFKSGSLYRCKPEPDFVCKKYMGNVENVMNSIAIIEHPDGRIYCVAIMSNVLRKNSAVEHQTLAMYIDRLIRNDSKKTGGT